MFADEDGRQHESNIDLLVLRYGSVLDAKEIKKVYDTIRSQQEASSSVSDYLFILVMREADGVLFKKAQEKSLTFV